jgi:hypothetical protein
LAASVKLLLVNLKLSLPSLTPPLPFPQDHQHHPQLQSDLPMDLLSLLQLHLHPAQHLLRHHPHLLEQVHLLQAKLFNALKMLSSTGMNAFVMLALDILLENVKL